MTDTVIKVENLSKLYHLGELHRHNNSFRDKISQTVKSILSTTLNIVGTKSPPHTPSAMHPSQNDDHIWALKDVSFEVKRGEILGIIGRNGAGKSTLLKILSKITKPTTGTARIDGRLSSLLEVGTGFHPELTGRENIYLNGAILGMKKAEINCKFDEIVAFAEVEKFIDTPVKRYSSGMYVRLAFAVAAHLDPDILIIDEVLAVGDVEFQKKCLGKMEKIAGEEGRTVLFVSHNTGMIKNLCQEVIILEKGSVVYKGGVNEGISSYLNSNVNASAIKLIDRPDRTGTGNLLFSDWWIEDEQKRRVDSVIPGQSFRLKIKFIVKKELSNVNIGIKIYNDFCDICVLSTSCLNKPIHKISHDGIIEFYVDKLRVNVGKYNVMIAANQDNVISLDKIENAFRINVVDGDFWKNGKNFSGILCLFEHEICVKEDLSS